VNLLHVTDSLAPESGGPAEVIGTFSREHASMGGNSEILVLSHTNTASDLVVHRCVPQARCQRFSHPAVSWLRTHASRFDAICAHGLWQAPSAVTWLALRRRDPKYFVFAHGMLDRYFRNAYPLKHARKQIYWLGLERHVVGDARGVIFTSAAEHRASLGTFWPSSFKALVCPIGVAIPEHNRAESLDRFHEAYPDLRLKPYLLFLGRLHPKKGLNLLVQAWRSGRFPMTLIIAGPEEDRGYAAELYRLATNLDIRFTGLLSGDLKWGAIYGADALVLPSYQENFGVAAVEALGCGVPVLLSTSVAIAEQVVHAGAGLSAEPSVTGIENLLTRWLAERSEKMRAAARACYLTHYQASTNVRHLLNLITEYVR
jgi:glycosyltransferase involved in cell wall biosynthesis